MASTAQPSYTIPSLSGPGIIFIFFRLRDSSQASQAIIEKWYDEVHIPAMVASGGIPLAWRWKAANPDYEKPNLVIYKLPDLAFLQSDEYRSANKKSETVPDVGPIGQLVEIETRLYQMVQLFETEKQPKDAFPTILSAAMEPSLGGAADLDSWYRDEHNQQMSEQPGWKRTTRFRIGFQVKDGKPADDAPSFLAIHEFGEGNKIGKDVVPLEPITDWTKRVLESCRAIDGAVYHKVGSS
ncbi:hypothetical protein AOQ84DRAFT_281396 [Glonium stellatum]|uniref:Uncharacterized protein n=1 Tax=Glonium stellatum TaxID=574774 RepID=A0A8E2JYG5_9PEZI|nr:hypothetical protein AOQ84DRAFT_281396 [Glonium stellatum]